MAQDKIFSLESSRDEKLERMIRDIAEGEVEEKVEKFKEDLEIYDQTNSFRKVVRSIGEESIDEKFEDSKALQTVGKFVKNKALPVAKKLVKAGAKAVKYGIVEPTKAGWDRDETATVKAEDKFASAIQKAKENIKKRFNK